MITPDDIAQACNDAGLDTPEALASFFTKAAIQNKVESLNLAIDDLNKERAAVNKPIDDKRIDLTNQRDALLVELRG